MADIKTVVKQVLRKTGTTFDAEIEMHIAAAKADLEAAGVFNADDTDPFVQQAICTYCKWHFGEPANPEYLQRSYEMQKAQLRSSTGYGLE